MALTVCGLFSVRVDIFSFRDRESNWEEGRDRLYLQEHLFLNDIVINRIKLRFLIADNYTIHSHSALAGT